MRAAQDKTSLKQTELEEKIQILQKENKNQKEIILPLTTQVNNTIREQTYWGGIIQTNAEVMSEHIGKTLNERKRTHTMPSLITAN